MVNFDPEVILPIRMEREILRMNFQPRLTVSASCNLPERGQLRIEGMHSASVKAVMSCSYSVSLSDWLVSQRY